MAAEIGIKITGDTSGLNSAAKSAADSINDIGQAAKNQTKFFGDLESEATNAYQRIADAANRANGGGNAFKPFGQGFDPGPTLRSLDEIEEEIKRVNTAIGANKDLSQFQKLDAELQKLELEARNLRVVGFESTFGKIGPAANQGAAGLDKLRRGSEQADQALVNVGRVAQDLPFGFIGIQNNLNPLLESFQRLKASTGSTGTALKSLAGSLVGAGGLGLALSVVSAGILIYQNGIAGFNKKTEEAKTKADEYKKALDGITSTIADEAVRVTVLVSALQSETTTRKEKKAAIEELKRINPEYFGQLNQEKNLVDTLKAAYFGYIESLKQQFAAKALDKQLSDLFNKKLDLEIKLTPTISTVGNKDVSAQIAQFQKQIDTLDPDGKLQGKDFLSNFTAGETQALNKINNLKAAIQTLQTPLTFTSKQDKDDLAKLNTQIDSLVKRRAEFGNFKITVPKGPKGPSDESELNKQITAINKQIAALEELQKQGLITKVGIQELFSLKIQKVDLELPKSGFTSEQANAIKTQLQVDAERALKALPIDIKIQTTKFILPEQQSAFPLEFPTPTVVIDTQKALKSATEAGKGAALAIKDGLTIGAGQVDIGAGLSDAINSNLVPAIENVAASIGDALSGGGFGAVLKGLASSIGQFIIDFGKILIEGAIKVAALKAAAKALFANPALAVAVGIAAIAVGTAIKNAAQKNATSKGFRDGGISDGPSSGYYALLHGKEVIAPYDKAAALLGGGDGSNMVVSGVLRADGRDLVAIIKSATKTNNRLGG